MNIRSRPLAAFLLASLAAAAITAHAGVRVDVPGPPRPPRTPLPADYRRSSNVQLVAGVDGILALGFGGDGPFGAVTFEWTRTSRTSGIVRVSHATAEDLVFGAGRTQELRDGRIDRIETATVDALEGGLRATSHGASAFYVEADGGIARTRLDGVVIEVVTSSIFSRRFERRDSWQVIAGTTLGHVWQPVHFPFGLLVELGWRTRFGAPTGSTVSAQLGLLGHLPVPPE